MPSTTLEFPVTHYKQDQMPEEADGTRLCGVLVNVADVPSSLDGWRALAGRFSVAQPIVQEKLRQRLLAGERPEAFHHDAPELLVFAERVDFDENRRVVRAILSDPEIHGLVMGLDTYESVRGVVERAGVEAIASLGAHVKLAFWTGISDPGDVVRLAEVFNASLGPDGVEGMSHK